MNLLGKLNRCLGHSTSTFPLHLSGKLSLRLGLQQPMSPRCIVHVTRLYLLNLEENIRMDGWKNRWTNKSRELVAAQKAFYALKLFRRHELSARANAQPHETEHARGQAVALKNNAQTLRRRSKFPNRPCSKQPAKRKSLWHFAFEHTWGFSFSFT